MAKFIAHDPPEIINGAQGDHNQAAIVFITNALAGLLGIYTIMNYIALEYFEHSGLMASKRARVSLIEKVLEFLIRSLAVSVVGLKLLKWEYFDDIFLFLVIVSLLLVMWNVYCLFLLRIEDFDRYSVLFHAPILALAMAAYWMTGDQERQVELAMWVFATEIVAIVLLVAANGVIVWNIGRRCRDLSVEFFTKWTSDERGVATH